MSFIGWLALAGMLLLAMALSSAWLRRLPVSTAAIYLAVGVALGPWGADVLRLDVHDAEPWLERLTEVAVILSLFIGGLRLRLPLLAGPWRAAYRLASVAMVLSIAGVAGVAALLFGMPWPHALLLGAILAPTDPVLASAISVEHAQDHDRMRYAVSGEAGLNDGTAFPFVVLGIGLVLIGGEFDSMEWALERVLWAVPAALVLGFLMGRSVGRFAIALRAMQRDTAAPTDFLALALVALSYAAADAIGAWGFLAVFAAGAGLRRAEIAVVARSPHPEVVEGDVHPPAETLVAPNTVTEREIAEPAVAAGVLVAEVFSFGDIVERLLEVLLVILVGVALAAHWDARALALAALLFLVIRPLSCWLSLAGTRTTRRQRLLVGWFGIRGIGSLYYLAHALGQLPASAPTATLADLVVSTIALSVIVHGASAQPLLAAYERGLRGSARSVGGGVSPR